MYYPYGMPTGMPNGMQAYNQPSRQEILKVNGRAGMEALAMSPNSSVLALDMNNPILWVAQADGAGYKMISSYNITATPSQPAVDMQDILTRITRLEERVNGKPDSGSAAARQAPSKYVRYDDGAESPVQGFRGQEQRQDPGADLQRLRD